MKLQFNWKYKDYELRAVPKHLAKLSDEEKNTTIELLKWDIDKDGKRYCFTVAYWAYKEDYELRIVGDRMFKYIDDKDIAIVWQQLKLAQKTLDKFKLEGMFEKYVN